MLVLLTISIFSLIDFGVIADCYIVIRDVKNYISGEDFNYGHGFLSFYFYLFLIFIIFLVYNLICKTKEYSDQLLDLVIILYNIFNIQVSRRF